MDAATIQARVDRGYAIAGSKLGPTYSQYRPASALAPLATVLRSLPVALDPSSTFSFTNPSGHGGARWHALIDRTLIAVGDYLIGQEGTFFVGARQALLPVICFQANRTVSVRRPSGVVGYGAQPYNGALPESEVVLMLGWPASVLLFGNAGQGSEAHLPGEPALGAFRVLLPYFAGVEIVNSDIIRDELGGRYVVRGAERTDLGWRLSARVAST
jgi:hypothetical protein